jgi:hypothetical protein
VRSIRLAKTLAWLSAGVGACLFTLAINRSPIPRLLGARHVLLVGPTIYVMVVFFAYSYLFLTYAGKFDPVVAWATNAWQKGDYESEVFRLHLFSWRGRRAPFMAFLLTSADLPDRAYAVATHSKLDETDIEEPSYNLDFAAGRAALAQGNLDAARRHLDRLYGRFPSSALARYALGDLLLWEHIKPDRANQLLSDAWPTPLEKTFRIGRALGMEAELRASYAWSLAVIGEPEDVQYSLDLAIQLAGGNTPVRAAVELRLVMLCEP